MGVTASFILSFGARIIFPQVFPYLASSFHSGLSSNVTPGRPFRTTLYGTWLPCSTRPPHPNSFLSQYPGFFPAQHVLLSERLLLVYLLVIFCLSHKTYARERRYLSSEPGHLGTQKVLGKKYLCKESMSSADHILQNIPCCL